MALSPMQLIRGLAQSVDTKTLSYQIDRIQQNAYNAISAIVSQLNGGPGSASAYWSGYHDVSAGWSTTSVSFSDFTPSGTANLIMRRSSNLSVTTAPSNLPGIVFSPAESGASFYLSANVTYELSSPVGNNAAMCLRLVNGATELAFSTQAYKESHLGTLLQGASVFAIVQAPSISPLSVTLQGQVGGDPGYLLSLGYTQAAIEWLVVRVA